jgi:aryl-alcohol dehydrogenase-like predicted oxidoreductase
MKKRRLGKSEIYVSEIGFGCWHIGGLTTINGLATTYGNIDSKTASKLINTALKFGINTFDTADIYSLGNSEKILGKILKNNRTDVKIFTKAGAIPTYSKTNSFEIDLSYHHLTAALDRSLKRLNTDYVDLFQAHAIPTNEFDYMNLKKTFKKMKKDGKALCCGKYKMNQTFPKTDSRSRYPKKLILKLLSRSKEFRIMTTDNMKLNQLALSYILNRDEISTCVPSSKNISQLKSNIDSTKIKLTESDLEKIEKIQSAFY